MKIFVLFVEPMLYGMDLIHEVYGRTEYEYQYVYCTSKLTGKDDILLPSNAFVCHGTEKEHKKQVASILERFRPDFVVINGYVGGEHTTAIKYCQVYKIPYAIESDTPLHIPSNKLKALAKKLYLRRLLHNPYCYGFPGGTLQKENLVYYGIPEEKNYIMPMSVSAERLLEVSEEIPEKETLKKKFGISDKKTFLFVGRLAKVKNVSLLIKAFQKIKEENSDTALLIVGDGTERVMLEQLVKEREIGDVIFSGYVVFPEIVQYYKMADVFILPSVHEPWGLVVNEAMIMGLPVIVSSDVGCRLDLIKDGKNGFIFESNNVKDLKRKMEHFINCDSSSYVEQAQETVMHWNYEYYLECFTRVIEDVAK